MKHAAKALVVARIKEAENRPHTWDKPKAGPWDRKKVKKADGGDVAKPAFDPSQPYNWVRVRLFGGRSLFWSRQSFRLSDYEFKAKSHDGFGEDWPISLADLDPYYSRVEEIFQVSGKKEGWPQMPDGNFIEDPDLWTESLDRLKTAGLKLNIPVSRQRRANGRDGLARLTPRPQLVRTEEWAAPNFSDR